MHACMYTWTPFDNSNNCSHLFYQKFNERFVYASIHAKLQQSTMAMYNTVSMKHAKL